MPEIPVLDGIDFKEAHAQSDGAVSVESSRAVGRAESMQPND